MRALPALLLPLPFLAGCISWLVPDLDSKRPCAQPRDLTPAAELANFGIGSIEGRYRGELPFDVQGRVGSARCHAIPPSFIAAERAKWRSELTEASRAFEAYTPTLDAPVDCHERPDFFSQLGQVTLMDNHGETTSPLMSDAQRNGVWAATEADLWAAKKGDTMTVSLFGGGTFYRKSKEGYDIPFVVVSGVYLRVY